MYGDTVLPVCFDRQRKKPYITYMKSERFEMRVSEELLDRVDEWRRQQADLPSRAEAMRRLIEESLKATKPSGRKSR